MLITTNDPVKIAENYAMLQHLAKGRVDLRASPRSRARRTTSRRSSGTARSARRAERTADDLDFDSPLMRLAAGGRSAPPERDAA